MASTPSQSLDDAEATVAATGTDGRRERDAPTLGPGDRHGRYVLLERIGRGAMGTVLAAYDEELDRRVAFKLVTGRPADNDLAKREAQAMAKVSHPNVVTVHDVGVFDGGVFIAMEFLRGGTLADRMRPVRPMHETLKDFIAAGQGLSAAHRAGLVHRDFKPANVLFDAEGRPKVGDFGLASAIQGEDETDERVVGTPAYMAPEQYAGGVVTPRADQFAFCVALHEALWGTRPFAGDTIVEIGASVVSGTLVEIPRSGVPPRIRRAVLRGLSKSEEERFPSMEALLAELDPDRRTRTLRRLGLLGAVGGAVGATVIAVSPAPAAPCDGGQAAIATVWNPEIRAGLGAATRDGTPGLPDRYVARVLDHLDEHAAQWAATFDEACQIRQAAPSSADDRRRLCLHQGEQALEALVDAAVAAPDVVLDSDVTRVLEDPTVCLTRPSIESLDGLLADPNVADEVFEVLSLEARSGVHRLVGQLKKATADGERALEIAERLGNPYLLGRALVALGAAKLSAVDVDGAEPLTARAYEQGITAGDLRVQAKAAERIMMIHGSRANAAECTRWYGVAAATQARAGATHGARVALALNAYECPQLAGDLDGARKILEAAVPLTEQMGTAGDELRGDLWFNIASLEWSRGNRDATMALVEAAEAAWGDRYPEGHRRAIATRSWRIVIAEADGDAKTVVRELIELARIKAQNRGEHHGEATYDDIAIVITQAYLGQADAARTVLAQVEQRHLRRPQAVSATDKALVHLGRGTLAEIEGDLDNALSETDAALELISEDDTWIEPQVRISRMAVLIQLGSIEAARALYTQSFGTPDRPRAWQASCWLVLGGDTNNDVLAVMRTRPEDKFISPYPVALCAAARALTDASDEASRMAAVSRLAKLRPGFRSEIEFVARALGVKAPAPSAG